VDRKITFRGEFNQDAQVCIPSSKSYIHRMAICAALAKGRSTIYNVNFSADIDATLACLDTLGCKWSATEDKIEITGGLFNSELNTFNCNESGSTLRFMVPVVLSCVGRGRFIGSPTLLKRPLDAYFDLFDENGIRYEYKAGEYLLAEGRFTNDEYSLDGSVSSQFVTGMMLALANSGQNKKIKIKGALSSAPYVDITREVMAQFGVNTYFSDNTFTIDASTGFKPCDTIAQGDYSQSAFFLVAAMLGGKITLKNLKEKTCQGDAVIISLIEKMGGNVIRKGDDIIAEKSKLKSLGIIDAGDFPDIVPPLALLFTQCSGDTVITNVNRLKVKESNRLEAVQALLNNLGADVKIDDNNMYIKGNCKLCGGRVNAFNDHRIAMTAAVASIVTEGSVLIEDSESVNKSYPHFFEDFEKLGGISIE